MQVRNFLHFLIISAFILILPQCVDGQRIAKNEEGEKIVVFPSGEWEYFDKTNPTHVRISKEYEASKLASPTEILDEHTSKGSEEEEDSTFEDLISLAEDKLALAEEKESDVRFSKILLEEEMDDLKEDESSSDKQYDQLKKQLKIATTLEKEAKKATKKAKKELDKLKKQGKVAENNSKKKAKKKKSKKSRKKKIDEKEMQSSQYTYKEDGTFHQASKQFTKYDIRKDVMYHPPQPECNLEFDGVDEFLGKMRKDVERSLFFTFTDDDMRRYMKEDEYISCEGNLTQIKGGVLLLNLFISINTTDAKRSFGELAKGTLVTIKMIDGSNVSLVNNQTDGGVYNPLTKRHTYTTQYRINSGQEKDLKKGEVDYVRIIWDTGYEDYEVYNLDFFRNQFKCLNK